MGQTDADNSYTQCVEHAQYCCNPHPLSSAVHTHAHPPTHPHTHTHTHTRSRAHIHTHTHNSRVHAHRYYDTISFAPNDSAAVVELMGIIRDELAPLFARNGKNVTFITLPSDADYSTIVREVRCIPRCRTRAHTHIHMHTHTHTHTHTRARARVLFGARCIDASIRTRTRLHKVCAHTSYAFAQPGSRTHELHFCSHNLTDPTQLCATATATAPSQESTLLFAAVVFTNPDQLSASSGQTPA
jgi:hypothetical protein